MAKKFGELRQGMSPERRQRNAAKAHEELLQMSLQELRQNVSRLSQDDVAEMLQVTQGYISKLERQDDMLLSNLYAYVQALGGEVEIRAKLPGVPEVQIRQFRDLAKLSAVLPRPKKTA